MANHDLGVHRCIIDGYAITAWESPLRRLYSRHTKFGKTYWLSTKYAICPKCGEVVIPTKNREYKYP